MQGEDGGMTKASLLEWYMEEVRISLGQKLRKILL